MNKTTASNKEVTRSDLINSITVDINQLCLLLNCGKTTAREIADKAGAGLYENKRVLYSVEKIKRYVDLTSV